MLARDYPEVVVADSLDTIKDLCFRYAAQSGSDDLGRRRQDPGREEDDPRSHEKEADKVEQQFRRGIITDGERRQKEVEIWTEATEEVRRKMEEGAQDRPVQPAST